MCKSFSFIALLLLFAACKNSTPEVVDITDVLPNSSHYEGEQEKVIVEEKAYSSIIPLASFQKNGEIVVDSISGFDDLHFLDRFENETFDKFTVHHANRATKIWIYSFKKGKANNAMVNWLNCFGTSCDQINLLDEEYLAKESCSIWQNDKNIVIMDRALVSEKEQMKWLNSFRLELGLKWNYQLVLQKGKTIVWTKDIELKEI